MKVPLVYAKLKCLSSLGPLPDYHHFKLKEQVMVEFASGYKTLGTILQTPNYVGPGKYGAKPLMYVFFKDKKYSHLRPLGGQECQCFEARVRKRRQDWQPASCPMHGAFMPQVRGTSARPTKVSMPKMKLLPNKQAAFPIILTTNTTKP